MCIRDRARAAELVDNNTILVVVDVNRPSITDAPELLRLVKTIAVSYTHLGLSASDTLQPESGQ